MRKFLTSVAVPHSISLRPGEVWRNWAVSYLRNNDNPLLEPEKILSLVSGALGKKSHLSNVKSLSLLLSCDEMIPRGKELPAAAKAIVEAGSELLELILPQLRCLKVQTRFKAQEVTNLILNDLSPEIEVLWLCPTEPLRFSECTHAFRTRGQHLRELYLSSFANGVDFQNFLKLEFPKLEVLNVIVNWFNPDSAERGLLRTEIRNFVRRLPFLRMFQFAHIDGLYDEGYAEIWGTSDAAARVLQNPSSDPDEFRFIQKVWPSSSSLAMWATMEGLVDLDVYFSAMSGVHLDLLCSDLASVISSKTVLHISKYFVASILPAFIQRRECYSSSVVSLAFHIVELEPRSPTPLDHSVVQTIAQWLVGTPSGVVDLLDGLRRPLALLNVSDILITFLDYDLAMKSLFLQELSVIPERDLIRKNFPLESTDPIGYRFHDGFEMSLGLEIPYDSMKTLLEAYKAHGGPARPLEKAKDG